MTDNVTGIGWRFEMPRFNGSAACAEVDPELFYPEPGGSTGAAAAICKRCPVRDECLAWALTNDERHGIWAGTSPQDRYELRRRRAS